MTDLLHRLVQQESVTDYTQMLLTALESQESTPLVAGSVPLRSDFFVEPLVNLNTKCSRLLAAGLTYEAIGEALIISLNTVRTHAKNIYSKLNVNRRHEAVVRAQALGLL